MGESGVLFFGTDRSRGGGFLLFGGVLWYAVGMVLGDGLVTLLLLCVQGASEVFFDTHKCLRVFRIQLIDYMENTMRARLENEYFHQEATEKYRMEYFKPEEMSDAEMEAAATDAVAGGVDAAGASGLPALTEIKELLESFREEMQLDRDIAGRQNMLSEQAAAEKAKLFEEILEEYM